jgi:FAD synthase
MQKQGLKIKGKVREGRKIGRTIGFPTLNMPYEGHKTGIFVGRVRVKGRWWRAAVHLGPRPTFGDSEIVCETFLIDWSGEIEPGTIIEVEVAEKIREIEKFNNLEDLKERISKDVEFVKNWYNSHSI